MSVAGRELRAVAADQVGRRYRRNQRPGALLLAQRPEQLAAEVLRGGQRAVQVGPEQRALGRIGAEEVRGRGHDLAADDGVVQRDVVAAEAPAPGRVAAGRAEDRDVIELRVAAALAAEVDREAFELVEDVVEPNDHRDGDVAGRRQAARDQPVDVALLDRAHRGERQAAVIGRRVVPQATLALVRERPAGDPALILVQGFDQRGRGLGHALRHHRRHRSQRPM